MLFAEKHTVLTFTTPMYLLIVYHEVQWNQAILRTFWFRRRKLHFNPARWYSWCITSCPTHHCGIGCGKFRLDKDSKRLKGRNMRHEKHRSPWTKAWSEHGLRWTHWQMPQWQPWDVPTNQPHLASWLLQHLPFKNSSLLKPCSIPIKKTACLPSVHQLIVPHGEPLNSAIRRGTGLFSFQFLIYWLSLSPILGSLEACPVEVVSNKMLGTWVLLTTACVSACSRWPYRSSLNSPFTVPRLFRGSSYGSKLLLLTKPLLAAALFWWLHAGCQWLWYCGSRWRVSNWYILTWMLCVYYWAVEATSRTCLRMRHKTVVNWCHCLFDQPRTLFLNVQLSQGSPLPAKLSIHCRFSGTARNMSIRAFALLSPPSRPIYATLACFGTSGRLKIFTHRMLENRQNILQFVSLPFIIVDLFRDTIPSCSCFTCGFRA